MKLRKYNTPKLSATTATDAILDAVTSAMMGIQTRSTITHRLNADAKMEGVRGAACRKLFVNKVCEIYSIHNEG